MGISTAMLAQSFESPNDLLSGWFASIEQPDQEKRNDMLSELFLDDGTIHTVLQRSSLKSSLKGGTTRDFLNSTSSFYETYSQSYDEIERSIDYYSDLCMVHSLVYQTLKDKTNSTVSYEQLLWFSFSMVYTNDRWYLTNVSWINAFDDESIEDSMRLDTIWHEIAK